MDRAMQSWLCGVSVGASVAFFFDPGRGPRRRALVRDKMTWAGRKTRDAVGATSRDVGNRISGLVAESRGMFSSDTPGGRVLIERVRAELGRVASRPRAIHVTARDGAILLSGDVLASEVSSIVSAVKSVRGVREMRNHLTVHETADGVPSLRGDSLRSDQWTTWLIRGWSPTAMLIAGSGAAAALVTAAVVTRR